MISAVDVAMGCDSSQIEQDLLSQGHTTFSPPFHPFLSENNMQHEGHVGNQERVVTVHVL